jgi:hypothetical protein
MPFLVSLYSTKESRQQSFRISERRFGLKKEKNENKGISLQRCNLYICRLTYPPSDGDFFRDNFNSTKAIEVVEKKASTGEAVRWIDYCVPLGEARPYLHLSVSACGHYHTGTFAYRWVRRGYNHGLRIVGTMKSGPAMNVLAAFER